VRRPLIALLTDFGWRDGFVGVMKGVILGINPEVHIVDLSHEIPPQDILAGALVLRSAVPFFPPGTIYVAVVDPGVGSKRRAILIETQRGFFIGPDNGLLSIAAPLETTRRMVHLGNPAYFLAPLSRTFHGRDVFAPVAAHLSRGVAVSQFGPVISEIERISLPAVKRGETSMTGRVIYIDHFGNVVTNISEADLRPFSKERLFISMGAMHISGIVDTYAAVEVGAPAALINSWGMLEIAVRDGSAARQFGIAVGCEVRVAS
jgi:S-adenosylmethionine hydrolase